MSSARPEVQHPRCPYCHEPVRPEQAKAACDGCMAWQHGACWSDHGRCAACEAPRGAAVDAAPSVGEARRVAGWVVAAAGGALVGGPLWLAAGPARGGVAALGAFVGFVLGAVLAALVGERRGARLADADAERAPEVDAWAVSRETEQAERGDVRAMRRVGEAHLRGVGVAVDEAAALAWFRRGAERGDLSCTLACVRLLERAKGTKDLPRPREEALRWARQAAQAGSVDGMKRLGLLLIEHSAAGAEPREGLRWLLDAAERGDVEAMIAAGWCHERGEGTPRDERQALRWYRRAATAGSSGAMVHVAALLERGVGESADLRAASEWYRRAAALAHPLGEAASDDMDDAADRLDDPDAPDLARADRAREAQEHRVDQATAHGARARSALDRGDVVAAAAHVERAVALLPEREGAEALALRATVREARGELEAALDDRRRVTELQPDEPWSWLYRARLDVLLGRRDDALEHLARGAACSDEPVWFRLWRVAYGADPRELEQDAGDDGEWTSWLARLLLRQVDLEALLAEAASDRWPSRRHDDNRCEVLGFAGLLADAAGDLPTARARYEACVATGASDFFEHEWARLRLEQLDLASAESIGQV